MKNITTKIMILVSLFLCSLLVGCPPPEEPQKTEPKAPNISTQEANKATCGISTDLNVVGTYLTINYGIKLNATMGTFVATMLDTGTSTGTSSGGNNGFSGTFLYNDGKLQLSSHGMYFVGEVAELKDGVTIQLTESTETDFNTAKTAFQNAVKSTVESLLTKINNSLKDAKPSFTINVKDYQFTDIKVKVFDNTFTVDLSTDAESALGMTFVPNKTTPAWFTFVATYLTNNGVFNVEQPAQVMIKLSALLGTKYNNILSFVTNLMLAVQQKINELVDENLFTQAEVAQLDAAEEKLGSFQDNRITPDLPNVKFIFATSTTESIELTYALTVQGTTVTKFSFVSANPTSEDATWLTDLLTISMKMSDEDFLGKATIYLGAKGYMNILNFLNDISNFMFPDSVTICYGSDSQILPIDLDTLLNLLKSYSIPDTAYQVDTENNKVTFLDETVYQTIISIINGGSQGGSSSGSGDASNDVATKIANAISTNWSVLYAAETAMQGIDASNDIDVSFNQTTYTIDVKIDATTDIEFSISLSSLGLTADDNAPIWFKNVLPPIFDLLNSLQVSDAPTVYATFSENSLSKTAILTKKINDVVQVVRKNFGL